MTVAANAGATSIQVSDASGLRAGDQITISSGTTSETNTISNIETSSLMQMATFLQRLKRRTTYIVNLVNALTNSYSVGTTIDVSAPVNCSNSSSGEPPMNTTEVVGQLKNISQLGAQAAQAALEAVNNNSHTPSREALDAQKMASAASDVWYQAFNNSLQAKMEAKKAMDEIRVLNKIMRKGSQAYATAINRVQISAPMFPR
jgi:hypothetical protein